MKHALVLALFCCGTAELVQAQSSVYQSAVSALSPTLWYKFDEASFGSTTSSQGSTTSTLGSSGFASTSNFWGDTPGAMASTQAGNVTSSNGSTIGAGAAGSIVFLFKTDNDGLNGTETLFLKGAGGTGLELLSLTAGQLSLRFRNTAGTGFNSITRTGIASNTWFFSAITWDVANTGDSISWSFLAMGGDLSGMSTLSGTGANATAIADTAAFQIGGRAGVGQRPANSSLDEFAVWTRRLSSSDINTLATATAATAIPEPSTFGALAGVLALGMSLVRRKRVTQGL